MTSYECYKENAQMCLFLSKTYQLRLRGGCCEGRGPDPRADLWSQDTWRQEVAQRQVLGHLPGQVGPLWPAWALPASGQLGRG